MEHPRKQRRQGIFWLLTIPYEKYVVPTALPDWLVWISGQREIGAGGFDHWQIVCAFAIKCSLRGVRERFGPYHAELTYSSGANAYVLKEETAVPNTRFELGTRPFARNNKRDWDDIWLAAQSGQFDRIPADVRVTSYRTLRTIKQDYASTIPMVRRAMVYWGPTATGKSQDAWREAGMGAYAKDPRSKFWDGYSGHSNVVIDEFRGGIDAAHILRWLDRYPVRVDPKGSSTPLVATCFWFTSNLPPWKWWPELDADTYNALERRLEIVEYFESA